MKTLRNNLCGFVLCIVLILFLTSCGRVRSHCYLCQGISYEAPCLVDLSTGDVIPLSVKENDEAISIQMLCDARIEHWPGETRADIPSGSREVNADLFCENCLTLVAATQNSGYVLADLVDLNSIMLYPIKNGKAVTILGHDISVEAEGDHTSLHVTTFP